MKALEAYLSTLIHQRGLQVQDVTAQAGVNANYLWRLRNDKIASPGAPVLRQLITAVRGNIDDLALLLRDDMTEREAQRLARRWVDEEGERERYAAEAAAMTDSELEQAIQQLEEAATNDPSVLQAWKIFLAGWKARGHS